MKSLFLNACISLILSGCNLSHDHYGFWIENNADYDVFLHRKYFEAKHFYPDTLFSIDVPSDRIFIKAHSTSKTYEHEKLEVYVQKMPKDTLSFFFFHADTVNKYSWEIIQRDYKILRRYDLSSQDIRTLYSGEKGTYPEIPYPPDERMKNMRMYPPYGRE